MEEWAFLQKHGYLFAVASCVSFLIDFDKARSLKKLSGKCTLAFLKVGIISSSWISGFSMAVIFTRYFFSSSTMCSLSTCLLSVASIIGALINASG